MKKRKRKMNFGRARLKFMPDLIQLMIIIISSFHLIFIIDPSSSNGSFELLQEDKRFARHSEQNSSLSPSLNRNQLTSFQSEHQETSILNEDLLAIESQKDNRSSNINPPYILNPLSNITSHIQDYAPPPPPTIVPIFFIKPHPDFKTINTAPSVSRFRFPNHRPPHFIQPTINNNSGKTNTKQTSDSQIEREEQTDDGRRPSSLAMDQWNADNNNSNNNNTTSDREFDFEKFDKHTTLLNNAEDDLEKQLRANNYQRVNMMSSLNHHNSNNNNKMNWTELLRQASESNIMESLMVTNKTMVSLLCDSDTMLLRLKFRHKFYGIMVAKFADSRFIASSVNCSLMGNGGKYYEWHIPLYDCGTKQEMPRLFMNSISIRFTNQLQYDRNHHYTLSELELPEEEEVKTIVCSYPIRPRAPPPPTLPPNLTKHSSQQSDRIIDRPDLEPAKLTYYEPIVLISGLLLLSLTLLGLATSAFLFGASSRRRRQRQRQRQQPTTQRDNNNNNNLNSTTTKAQGIYGSPPSRVANFRHLAPPIISLDPELIMHKNPKLVRHKQRHRMQKFTAPVSAAAAAPKRSSNMVIDSSTYPNKRGKWNRSQHITSLEPEIKSSISSQEASSDSLADTKSSSVTTIEIPFVKSEQTTSPSLTPAQTRKVEGENKSVWLKRITTRKSTTKLSSTTTQIVNRERKSPKSDIKDEATQSNKNADADADADANEKVDNEDISSKILPFGSLRAKLTSYNEYKRLQEISEMFSDSLQEVEDGSSNEATQAGASGDSLDGKVLIYTLKDSKYKPKIKQLSENELKAIKSLLHNDELFRSLVVDSTDRETFERKLLHDMRYADKLKPETWLLLEEILLDKDLPTRDPAALSDSRLLKKQPPAIPPKPKTIASKQFNRPTTSKDLKTDYPTNQQQQLPPTHQNQHRYQLGSRSHDPTSSIPKEETERENQTRISNDTNIRGALINDTTGIRVSKFNTSTTRRENGGGLSNTLINIDSEMNFSTSKDFSAYTRSRIEHTRYHTASSDHDDDDDDDGSLHFMDSN